jgi:hypothetical protein
VIIVFGGSSFPNETKNLQQEVAGSRVRHLGSREWVSVKECIFVVTLEQDPKLLLG